MKKLILLLSIIILLIIMMTGCFQGKIHIIVNKNGSGDVILRFGMDSTLLGLASTSGTDPLERIIEEAKINEFEISKFKEDKIVGFEAKKHIINIEKLIRNESLNKEQLYKLNDVQIKKGFFYDIYTLNTNIDVANIVNNNSFLQDKTFQQAFQNQIDIDFMITLPLEAEKHNASKVVDENKTYVWNIIAGENNEIFLVIKKPNILNFIIVAGFIFIIILLGIKKLTKSKYIS